MADLDRAAIVHLYRGELGRLVDYRVRLDTTTNWALASSVAVISFALGQPQVSHAVMVLPYALGLLFLWVESRRYREMLLARDRVRLLERGFFVAELGGAPLEGWREALAESLSRPAPPMSLEDAIAVRLRRNYVWLFLTLYGAWWLDLALVKGPVVDAARVGLLPGAWVLVISTLLVLPLVVLAFARRPPPLDT